MSGPPRLELRHISKAYQEGDASHQVLNDLNLVVQPGSSVALLGRSGSGKTTLLAILNALISPDRGEYLCDGRPIHNMNEADKTLFRRYSLSMIFQYYNLIPSLTARENIEFALHLTGKTKALSNALEYCKLLDVEACLDKLPAHLSGGQQQRVAIIRALSVQPKLLLADEPTGNLDQHTGNEVAGCLYEGVRQYGITLVLATHSHELAQGCDIKYFLKEGQLERVEV